MVGARSQKEISRPESIVPLNYSKIPIYPIFYLLKGDYILSSFRVSLFGVRVRGSGCRISVLSRFR